MKTNPTDLFLIKKNKIYSKWTAEEDQILIESLKNLKIRNKWKTISKLLNKKVFDCINRYKSINTSIKKGHWTDEEDQQVTKLIQIYGKNWAQISSIMKKRTGKQIRQRFLNFLDPKINKEKFTIDEDMKIYQLFKVFKTNWRYYIKHFPDRTADMIKGRYYSSIRFKENLLRIVEGLSGDQVQTASKANLIAAAYEAKKFAASEENNLSINNLTKKTQCDNIKNNSQDQQSLEAKSEKACFSSLSPLQPEKPKFSGANTKITYLETQLNTTNSCIDSNEFISNSVDAEIETDNDKNISSVFNSNNNSYANINSNHMSNNPNCNANINNFNNNNKLMQIDYMICQNDYDRDDFQAKTQTDFNEFDSNMRLSNDDCLFDGCNFESENFLNFNSGFKFDF